MAILSSGVVWIKPLYARCPCMRAWDVTFVSTAMPKDGVSVANEDEALSSLPAAV